MAAQQLGDDEHEVGRRRADGQLAVEADADDGRHRLVERLAEEDRLGLDATDAVAQDAEGVDHRRVRVGAHERVGIGDGRARAVRARLDDGRQVLEVDLVDDARAGRHDAQVAERRLRPAQKLIALAVALVLAGDVEGEGAVVAEAIDLHRVVDDQVGRHQRVDARRVPAEGGHRIAHGGQVDDGGHAGEVLEDDPCGHERQLDVDAGPRPPARQGAHVGLADDAVAGVAQQVLEQDLDRDRESSEVGGAAAVEPIDDHVAAIDRERGTAVEGISADGERSRHRGGPPHPRSRVVAGLGRRLTGVPVSGRAC